MQDYGWIDNIKPIPEFPDSFRFDLFKKGGKHFGRLAQDVQWQTDVKGHAVRFAGFVDRSGIEIWVSFELFPDGVLNGYSGCEWDFGTGAIDDLCVIYPSLKHDIGCDLTNKGLIPWEWRKYFDSQYRKGLSFYGCPWYRQAWQWSVVRFNSKFVAYWKVQRRA
jgi:hypothetical protein